MADGCGTCFYMRSMSFTRTDASGASETYMAPACCFNSPDAGRLSNGEVPHAAWPEVDPDYWCGEFAAAP